MITVTIDPSSVRVRPLGPPSAIVWILVLLSAPIAAIALWISLTQGEQTYRFVTELRPKLSESAWHIMAICRVISWALLPVAIVQIVAVAGLFWGSLRRTFFYVLLFGSLIGLSLEFYWLPRMMPTVTQRRAMLAERQ